LDRTVPAGVPKVLYVLIIIILVAMYYYAAFVDVSQPEQVVEEFYTAYFDRDFETVSKDLSVFWSVQLLPQYTSQSPAELLNNRDEIVKEVGQVIADQEKENPLDEDYSVEVIPEYTRQGANSALVVYSIKENGREINLEMAVLIKEDNKFRIFSMMPTNKEALATITDEDFDALEESLGQLLQAE
jgi:hypothetical protein